MSSVPHITGFIVLLLVGALLAEPLARWTRLPHSSFLVIVGVVAAYVVTLGLGIDTGLRATNFHDLIFFVLLPVLIFDAAFKIPVVALRKNLAVILFLAIVGMLLTTMIAAVLLYFGIGHPTGFPWLAALLAGALLAATDPVAVVSQLKSVGAPEDLAVLLEGESLFNDATAIVVFGIILTLATMPAAELSAWMAIMEFLRVFIGGTLVGVATAAVAGFAYRHSRTNAERSAVTISAAYGSFLIAEGWLHMSGVMAVLVCGLWLARIAQTSTDKPYFMDELWETLAYIANGSVFLLMGMTITVSMFEDRWLAMLIAILAIFVARSAAIFGGLYVVNRVVTYPVPTNHQRILLWGGLRGAVTLALALSLPHELDYWYTIQSMAFGVVLFTLFIQAPTMPPLLRRLI